MWIIGFLGSFLIPFIMGQSCNYMEEIGAVPLNISSPNYPKKYEPNIKCLWTTSTYSAYKLKLTCSIVQINAGVISDAAQILTGGLLEICPTDNLEISRTGRTDFADGVKYCGNNSFSEFTVTSVSNKMNIRFESFYKRGGKFSCILERIPNPCECGHKKDSRIVGGEEAGVNQYPWVAGFVVQDIQILYCVATIISNRIAVTSKSCIIDKPMGKPFNETGLLVGNHDILKGNDSIYTALYRIKNAMCYNECIDSIDPIRNGIDIGLLITEKNIEFNAGVAPACLPYAFQFNSFSGSKVEVAGWGEKEFGGKRPNELQKVQLDVISQTTCASYHNNNYDNLTNDQICTYTSGKGLCSFDQGAGLQYTGPYNGRVYVIGVVSYVECAIKPDVSTRVTSVLKWIEDKTRGFGYDYCKI